MQPPDNILKPILREYIQQLQSEASIQPHHLPEKQQQSTTEIYTHSIIEWVKQLTSSQQSRSYTIEEIAILAKPKGLSIYRPSNQCIGEALRRAGFISKRDWTKAGRNKRYWKYTPGSGE